jgi:hypothetical protein
MLTATALAFSAASPLSIDHVVIHVRDGQCQHVTKPRHTLDQHSLKFIVRHGLILARCADFSTLDPLAAENGLSLYRRVRSAELAAVIRCLANFLGFINQRFGSDNGPGSECTFRRF